MEIQHQSVLETLQGRIALVTGSSQGLGRIIARTLADAGCTVLVNASNHPENAERVATEIRSTGGNVDVCCCDVSSESNVNNLFKQLLEKYGAVDILVNNARLDPWRRTGEMSEGEWFSQVIDVNLKGAFLMSQAFFAQACERRWGRIVNISSVRAFRPAEPHMIAYGVSKLGMHALTRAYAHNGAPFGITANTVAPGVVITENINKRLTPEKYASEIAAVPIGRASASEEIADAVLFVIRNSSVTGETININGGMYYAP